MTHRFPWSRLAEIDKAKPMPRVAFPTLADVGRLRHTLALVRQTLAEGERGITPCDQPGRGT